MVRGGWQKVWRVEEGCLGGGLEEGWEAHDDLLAVPLQPAANHPEPSAAREKAAEEERRKGGQGRYSTPFLKQ